MSVSTKEVKTATIGVFVSVLAATQAIGAVIPDNCAQNLNQCSLQIWTHNSFPHRGVTQSVTFSDGQTLTCTSNGPNTPRSCTLTPQSPDAAPSQTAASPSPDAAQAAAGPPLTPTQAAADSAISPLSDSRSPGNPLLSGLAPATTLARQCAELKTSLRDLMQGKEALQAQVDRTRVYLAQALQMTPALLDSEIQRQQSLAAGGQGGAGGVVRDFLADLRANQALGTEMGGATTAQMQARANRIIQNLQSYADGKRPEYDAAMEDVGQNISKLDCDNTPAVNQSVPGNPTGAAVNVGNPDVSLTPPPPQP